MIDAQTIVLAADRAAHALTWLEIGGTVCSAVAVVGGGSWKAFRTARKERQHQTEMLSRVHGGLFGEPAQVEAGVTVKPKTDGLIDRVTAVEKQLRDGTPAMQSLVATIDRNHQENSQRLDRHERQIAEARHVAGEAATTAAAAKDRLEFLSGRWWEYAEGLNLNNRFLRSTLEQAGFEVGEMPEETDGLTDMDDPRPAAD